MSLFDKLVSINNQAATPKEPEDRKVSATVKIDDDVKINCEPFSVTLPPRVVSSEIVAIHSTADVQDDEAGEIPQCRCGSHLSGECPECDNVPSLADRLRAIGDAREINPPDVKAAEVPAPGSLLAAVKETATKAVEEIVDGFKKKVEESIPAGMTPEQVAKLDELSEKAGFPYAIHPEDLRREEPFDPVSGYECAGCLNSDALYLVSKERQPKDGSEVWLQCRRCGLVSAVPRIPGGSPLFGGGISAKGFFSEDFEITPTKPKIEPKAEKPPAPSAPAPAPAKPKKKPKGPKKLISDPLPDVEVEKSPGQGKGVPLPEHGGKCHFCGKAFQVLGRHRCKEKDIKRKLDETLARNDAEIAATKREMGLDQDAEPSVPLESPPPESRKSEEGPEPSPPPEDTAEKTGPEEPLFDVVFDALFEKADGLEIVRLESVLEKIEKDLAKETKVPHWTLIEYNKGPGMLAALFEYWIQKKVPRDVVILADGSTAATRAVKDVLRRYARTVIQGVR